MLIVYGEPLATYEEILKSRDVLPCEEMRFVTEAEHVHSSNELYQQQFQELRVQLGMDGVFA